MRLRVLILLVVALTASAVMADNAHTKQLAEGASSPPAAIEDIAWIAGSWSGEAFGGVTEEVWTPPLGDSMMASFKLVAEGVVQFYEIEVIREVEESLVLQLKHFHGDLKGWEEKDETVDFPLVELAENAAYFAGMTFERVTEDELHVWVLIGGEDGEEAQEAQFIYQRVRAE